VILPWDVVTPYEVNIAFEVGEGLAISNNVDQMREIRLVDGLSDRENVLALELQRLGRRDPHRDPDVSCNWRVFSSAMLRGCVEIRPMIAGSAGNAVRSAWTCADTQSARRKPERSVAW
jgi:hypothetical protein